MCFFPGQHMFCAEISLIFAKGACLPSFLSLPVSLCVHMVHAHALLENWNSPAPAILPFSIRSEVTLLSSTDGASASQLSPLEKVKLEEGTRGGSWSVD